MRFRFCGDLDCPDWVLSEISTLSNLTSLRIKILVEQIISHFMEGSFQYDKVKKIAESSKFDDASNLKGAISALGFIITSAAKYDVDATSLLEEIQQLGLPKENSECISRQYIESKDSLRSKFVDNSLKLPSLKTIDWRLDSVLSASTPDEEQQTIIHLNLAIENQYSNEENIHFELSAVKLDVLIHELTNAEILLKSLS